MKYLKISIFMFLLTFVFASVTTYAADYQVYAGLTLPAFKKEIKKGPKSKTVEGEQKYYNDFSINSCTGNNNDIGVRVSTEYNGYSDRATVSVGSTSTIPADERSTEIDAYNLHIRNNVISPCEAYHGGIWYYN